MPLVACLVMTEQVSRYRWKLVLLRENLEREAPGESFSKQWQIGLATQLFSRLGVEDFFSIELRKEPSHSLVRACESVLGSLQDALEEYTSALSDNEINAENTAFRLETYGVYGPFHSALAQLDSNIGVDSPQDGHGLSILRCFFVVALRELMLDGLDPPYSKDKRFILMENTKEKLIRATNFLHDAVEAGAGGFADLDAAGGSCDAHGDFLGGLKGLEGCPVCAYLDSDN